MHACWGTPLPLSPSSRLVLWRQVSEIAKQIGAEWKNLPDAQKQPYQAKADKLKEGYRLQKQDYEASAAM